MATRILPKGFSKNAFVLVIVIAVFTAFSGRLAAAPGAKPTFAVLGPLFLSNQQQINDFKALLSDAKSIGVEAVAIDVWWGEVQPTSANNFNWNYYIDRFNDIKSANLKVIPILSFHKCGGGPGDTCKNNSPIPIPDWVWGLAPDMKYQSETGEVHDDAVSVWATKNPAVLNAFKNFIDKFAVQFQSMAGDFAEINISLGPTGELRYPSYNENLDNWRYPHRGFFQFYSNAAGDDFRQWALAKYGNLQGVNQAWGFQLLSNSDIRVPQNPDQFVAKKEYEEEPYGRDVIDWYNGSLVEHGRRLLKAADTALDATMPNLPMGMKLPGIHWQMQNTATPRIAEITAGLVQTTKNLRSEPLARGDAFGYENIMDMIAQVKTQINRDLILHFTAVEMDNDPQICHDPNNPSTATSMAEALVFWISHSAADRGIAHKAENALGCVNDPDAPCDDRSWVRIRNVFEFAPYSGLAFLRLWDKPDQNSCVPWNPIDRTRYAQFIQDFKDRRMVTVHLSEWEPCIQDAGCNYYAHTWNNGKGANASFALHYEGQQPTNGIACRHWWTGQVANVAGGFDFTAYKTQGDTTTWEGNVSQFDRTYNPAQHGYEIFVLGRQNATVFTSRPSCP